VLPQSKSEGNTTIVAENSLIMFVPLLQHYNAMVYKRLWGI